MRSELTEVSFPRLRIGGDGGAIVARGTGSPEGVQTAPVGSLFLRSDGGANTSVYRKESGAGNIGWVAVSNAGGGGSSVSTIEVDFGPSPVGNKTFTIIDGSVSAASKIMALHSGEAATGRQADENEMDAIIFRATPQVGQYKLYADVLTGKVSGKYKVNVLIT